MNIRSTLSIFSPSLPNEISIQIDSLQRSLIQSELAAFDLESRILSIKSKIDYLRELQDTQIKRDMQA